ncbi:hypothetical protein [Asanoa siamensis]|uniref:Uncharacterized protein n=1 Tax=Asanoa siamensis TaxID=926357 RepID=A0ABQ4CWK0_9ACTN|nr:hypothetical protein [Asanoa siamensis]GIF75662.1 hypothetical protein Asi02nite_51800 [Asanoa siamensis]
MVELAPTPDLLDAARRCGRREWTVDTVSISTNRHLGKLVGAGLATLFYVTAEAKHSGQQDYWRLTDAGEHWLATHDQAPASPIAPGAAAPRARGRGAELARTADGFAPVADRDVVSGEVLAAEEHWETGDIVLAADRSLWCRAHHDDIAQGWPWAYAAEYAPRRSGGSVPEGAVEEHVPVRPLTLLLRDGRPVITAPPTLVGSPSVAARAAEPEPARAPVDPNASLRAALRDWAASWVRGVPPHLTTEVAAGVFERLLATHPGAAPEVIAVALIGQADQWDEVDAVIAAVRRFVAADPPRDARRAAADAPGSLRATPDTGR